LKLPTNQIITNFVKLTTNQMILYLPTV